MATTPGGDTGSLRTGAPAGLIGFGALAATIMGVLLWAVILGGPWRLVSGLLDARTHLDGAQTALAEGRIKAARYETLAGVAAAERARSGLEDSGPAIDIASLLPQVEAASTELDLLVSALGHSATAARDTLEIAQGAFSGPDKIIVADLKDKQGGSRFRLDRVAAISESIASIGEDILAARRALEAIDLGALPGRARGPIARGIQRARATGAQLADAAAGLEILPGFLGADGPRHYLLGMQNSAELRGTGGAMLRFAVISMNEGSLSLEPDQSAYDVDENRQPISIPLPAGAWYVEAIEDAQRFGNANWSPDWPLSGKLTLRYAQASGRNLSKDARLPSIDGVFAVDPITMEQVLPGAGGYDTAGGRRVTAAKVVNLVLNRAYAAEPTGKRRIVLRGIVNGFYESLLKPDHPSALVDGFGRALGQKHMQLWMKDDAEQEFIERMNWDGAIDPAEGSDFSYVVEQNVGGNKLNFFEEMTTSLEVEVLGRDAAVRSEVHVTNSAFLPQPRYVLGDVGRSANSLPNGWALHRPMINLYAPARAELLDARPLAGSVLLDAPAPAIWTDGLPPEHMELDKKVWSATLEIPVGHEGAVRFDYRVPDAVRRVGDRSVYRLVLQHQPKVRPETTAVTLTLPAGARDVVARGWKRSGDELRWEKVVNRDMELEVTWRT